MVSTLLLVVIYFAFISLGLPDSVLGAAWPVMHQSLNVPLSFAGILSMTCTCGTIISALSFSFISRKFKTSTIVSGSTALTAIALFLYGIVGIFYALIPVALLLGLGAGSIDAALNNYVALHYKAKQMSFLHACWGIGTTVSPFILAYIFSNNLSWHFGYIVIASMQSFICIILFVSAPLWKKNSKLNNDNEEEEKATCSYKEVFMKKGAPFALLGFFCYSSIENTAILWSATYSMSKGLNEANSATASGLLFWGITIGRILTGICSEKIGDKNLIRVGICLILISLVILPLLSGTAIFVALFLLGMGCAPIYPSMIHQTPFLYGREASSTLIGLEMASSCIGSIIISPLFGVVSTKIGVASMPFYMSFFLLLLIISSELKRGGKK